MKMDEEYGKKCGMKLEITSKRDKLLVELL